MAAGAVVLVAVFVMLAVPKSVRAVVATLVRDIDNPARATLVYQSCYVQSTVPTGSYLECAPNYTVPATDRLVIQQVEAACQTPPGNSLAETSIDLSTNGNSEFHTFTLANGGPNAFYGGVEFDGDQAVTYHADPGSTPVFASFITDPTGNTNCLFKYSGYLISYP
ncbi:MAG: hypothetical protein ABSG16_12685 [Candidatus Acidiferrum sp.]